MHEADKQRRARAQREATEAMTETAKANETMTYTDLTQTITALKYQPRSKQLSDLLADVSRREEKAGRGMLSVVVVAGDTGMPGDGFFELASELGRDTSDWKSCFTAELAAVHHYWSEHQE